MDLKRKSTTELFKLLKTSESIDAFITAYDKELEKPSFSSFVGAILIEKNLTISQVIISANMNESYCYQLFKGTRNPSRDKIIQLALGMTLSVQELNKLLRIGGKGELYCRDKRDAILIFAINQGSTFHEVEELLYDRGLATLNENT